MLGERFWKLNNYNWSDKAIDLAGVQLQRPVSRNLMYIVCLPRHCGYFDAQSYIYRRCRILARFPRDY